MALDPDQVVVAGTGNVYFGTPDVSTVPATVSTAIDIAGVDGWVEAGFTAEDGVQFMFGKETKPIKGWQSSDALRIIKTGTPSTVALSFLQWNHATMRVALGGGSVQGSSPNFVYYPPPPSYQDVRSMIVEGRDGDYTYRFIFHRVLNEAPAEFSFVREDAVALPIKMTVLSTDSFAQPWALQTNDPEIGTFALVGT